MKRLILLLGRVLQWDSIFTLIFQIPDLNPTDEFGKFCDPALL